MSSNVWGLKREVVSLEERGQGLTSEVVFASKNYIRSFLSRAVLV